MAESRQTSELLQVIVISVPATPAEREALGQVVDLLAAIARPTREVTT